MFPRFKRKGQGDSFRCPDAKQFEIDQANSRIRLPKLGWIRYRNSRDILGMARNVSGHEDNADVVGAINILARGHRVAACGEPVQSGRSMKQEPTEAI